MTSFNLHEPIIAVVVKIFIKFRRRFSPRDKERHPRFCKWNWIGNPKIRLSRFGNPSVVVSCFLTEPTSLLHQNARVFIIDES